jgi:hypothetical protein
MRCFQSIFKLLSERVGKDLNRWRHLHNDGFNGMTVDMDWKQMEGIGSSKHAVNMLLTPLLGFGLYLKGLDASSRPWDWQLQNCIRFCVVHFKRSITQATPGLEHHQDSVHSRMEALLTCQSMDDYHALGNLLRGNSRPHEPVVMELLTCSETESLPIANWAAHKLIPVIAAGLNQHCSLIPKDVWDTMSPDSNAAEQTAEKSYSYGKGLPLLSAVLRSVNVHIPLLTCSERF